MERHGIVDLGLDSSSLEMRPELVAILYGDDELIAFARRELFRSVVGDVTDKLQSLHQLLPPAIQPLERRMARPINDHS